MGDNVLDVVRADVQAGVEKAGKKWKDSKWEGFVQEVVQWLIHDKNKDPDDVADAAVGLILYGVTNEEELQIVSVNKDQREFTEKLTAKGVPDAICDLLFDKYVAGDKSLGKRRAGSGGSQDGDAKRMCIDQDSTGAMDRFIRELNNGVQEEVDGNVFIRFTKALLGLEEYPPLLFVRECYDELYPMVESMLNDEKEPNKVVLVMGTPGVGKTVFGLYAAFKLLQKGETVMYYHGGNNEYYLLGPKSSPIIKTAREEGFDVPLPEGDGVYIGRVALERGMSLVKLLEEQKELFYVHDPPRAGINIREGIQCKLLVVSSPHRGAENSLKNKSRKRYMPTWSYAELKAANENCGQGLSEEVLLARWAKYGGVARWVLASGEGEEGATIVADAIGMMTHDRMKDLLDPFANRAGVSKDHSGVVVHMRPTEDLRSYTTRLATSSMFEEIRTKLKLSTNKAVLEWAESMDKVSSIGVGTIMEQCWHNQLAFGGEVKGCTIRELTDVPLTDKKMEKARTAVTVPKFTRTVTFARNDMRDLNELYLGEYGIPLTPNFPTVDSIVGLNKPFCDPKNNNTCLVGFQMTVSTTGHDLNLAGGRLIRQKFKDLFSLPKVDLANMYIVFVTTRQAEPSFKAKQQWKTQDNAIATELSAVRQFVLVLPET